MQKGSPATFALSLHDDFEPSLGANVNTYSKHDTGLVIVHFNVVRKDSEVFAGDSTIATTPVGFRPDNIVSFAAAGATIPGSASSSAYSNVTARAYIGSNGSLRIRHRDTGYERCNNSIRN